jgi:hypothetical protein
LQVGRSRQRALHGWTRLPLSPLTSPATPGPWASTAHTDAPDASGSTLMLGCDGPTSTVRLAYESARAPGTHVHARDTGVQYKTGNNDTDNNDTGNNDGALSSSAQTSPWHRVRRARAGCCAAWMGSVGEGVRGPRRTAAAVGSRPQEHVADQGWLAVCAQAHVHTPAGRQARTALARCGAWAPTCRVAKQG